MKKTPKKKVCSDKDCSKEFTPYKTTDKFCSFTCSSKNVKPLKKTELSVPYEKKVEYATQL